MSDFREMSSGAARRYTPLFGNSQCGAGKLSAGSISKVTAREISPDTAESIER
jgi:hypothetical protein